MLSVPIILDVLKSPHVICINVEHLSEVYVLQMIYVTTVFRLN